MDKPKLPEYPTDSQIEEMFDALAAGSDEGILAVLRRRQQERQGEERRVGERQGEERQGEERQAQGNRAEE